MNKPYYAPLQASKPVVLFLLLGILNTAATFVVYTGLNPMLGYRMAYLIAYIGGIVLAYFANTWFVFKQRVSYRSFIKFPFVYLVKYPLAAVLLEFFIRMLEIPVAYAPLFVVALLAPATFLLMRLVLSGTK